MLIVPVIKKFVFISEMLVAILAVEVVDVLDVMLFQAQPGFELSIMVFAIKMSLGSTYVLVESLGRKRSVATLAVWHGGCRCQRWTRTSLKARRFKATGNILTFNSTSLSNYCAFDMETFNMRSL